MSGVTPSAQFGQVTVGTSAVQITSTNNNFGVVLKALAANTGKVYVGNSSAVTSSTGFELSAGDTLSISVNNANDLWAISTAPSQGLCFAAN